MLAVLLPSSSRDTTCRGVSCSPSSWQSLPAQFSWLCSSKSRGCSSLCSSSCASCPRFRSCCFPLEKPQVAWGAIGFSGSTRLAMRCWSEEALCFACLGWNLSLSRVYWLPLLPFGISISTRGRRRFWGTIDGRREGPEAGKEINQC